MPCLFVSLKIDRNTFFSEVRRKQYRGIVGHDFIVGAVEDYSWGTVICYMVKGRKLNWFETYPIT